MGWEMWPPSSTAWQRTCGIKTVLPLLQEPTAPGRRQRVLFDTGRGFHGAEFNYGQESDFPSWDSLRTSDSSLFFECWSKGHLSPHGGDDQQGAGGHQVETLWRWASHTAASRDPDAPRNGVQRSEELPGWRRLCRMCCHGNRIQSVWSERL